MRCIGMRGEKILISAYHADPDVRLRRARAEPGISARACRDGEARSRPARHDAVVGAVCSGAAGAGAIAAQHLRRRPAVQLHQVPLGAAPVQPGVAEMVPEPVRPGVHPALTAAAGDHLVDPVRRHRSLSSGGQGRRSGVAEVRRAAQRIDAEYRKSTPWWGRCDLDDAHIFRAADRPVLTDLYRAILNDVAGVHRQIPRERMRYALDIRISPGRTATPRSLP